MADHQSDGAGQRPATTDVESARNVFDAFRDELDQLLAEVRAGRTAQAKRLKPIVTELARAVTRMADEEGKVHGAGHGQAGREGGAGPSQWTLDLDAARDEVCRRLARLRSAGT